MHQINAHDCHLLYVLMFQFIVELLVMVRDSDRQKIKASWATTWQNKQNECAPSEDSDQPGHPPSLIRVFAVAWRKIGSLATHEAHSEESDQIGQMPRLIWVFARRTLLVLSCRGSLIWHCHQGNTTCCLQSIPTPMHVPDGNESCALVVLLIMVYVSPRLFFSDKKPHVCWGLKVERWASCSFWGEY